MSEGATHLPCDKGCQPDWHRDDCAIYTPVMRPDECPKCLAYATVHGHALVGACASVGIEHKMTTTEMLVHYLVAYHDRGHKEAAHP